MTEPDRNFEEMMAVAREQMDKYKVALSVLAQGERSPYWTDELAAEIEAAKRSLDKYRTSAQGT